MASSTGAVVFTAEMNAGTGEVTVTQYQSLQHPTGGALSPDEAVSLTAGALQATVTIQDADGDTLTSSTADIGARISFQDDGPSVTDMVVATAGAVVTDETNQLGVTVVGAASVFTGGVVTLGADGGTSDVSLKINVVETGFKTTVGGHDIKLVADANDNNIVYGKYDTNADGTLDATAFTVEISNTGVLSVTQFVAMVHPDPATLAGEPPDTSSYDEAITLGEKLSAVVTATDGDGDTLSANAAISAVIIGSAIRFEDDGPSMGTADHGFVGNQINTIVTGDLPISFGADGAGFASLLGNLPPGTLSSGNAPVNYYVNPLDPDTLIAYTGGDPTANQVFKLEINAASDTYTFTLYQTLDAQEVVSIGGSTSFGSGPTGSQILTSATGTQLAVLTGWDAATGLVQNDVNGSTAGWGVGGNNTFSVGEMIRVDFDDQDFGVPTGFNGPSVMMATFEFIGYKAAKTTGNPTPADQVTYKVYYTDNTSESIVTLDDPSASQLVVTADPGKFIDYIEFIDTIGAGKFDLVDVSTITNTGTLNLNFSLGLTDADGDMAILGSIAITVDGSNPIDGTASADALAGTSGADTINGLGGNDDLIGGLGNDTLTGGAGSDTFVWTLNETGADKIMDFTLAPAASGGDVLDLKDLLVGEHSGGLSPNLTEYLHFADVGGKAVISVDADGTGAVGVTQTITLDNVTLLQLQIYAGGAGDDAAIIAKLLTEGNLKTEI